MKDSSFSLDTDALSISNDAGTIELCGKRLGQTGFQLDPTHSLADMYHALQHDGIAYAVLPDSFPDDFNADWFSQKFVDSPDIDSNNSMSFEETYDRLENMRKEGLINGISIMEQDYTRIQKTFKLAKSTIDCPRKYENARFRTRVINKSSQTRIMHDDSVETAFGKSDLFLLRIYGTKNVEITDRNNTRRCVQYGRMPNLYDVKDERKVQEPPAGAWVLMKPKTPHRTNKEAPYLGRTLVYAVVTGVKSMQRRG